MNDISCILLSSSSHSDEIGNQIKTTTKLEIPIIKVEDVYQNEFYSGNQQGFKPCLRLRINKLNYNNEEELVYLDTIYKIIRSQNNTYDEIVLVCERKIGNATNINK